LEYIQTILGRLKPEDIGITLSHEHVIVIPPKRIYEKDPITALDDVEKSSEELRLFYEAGGKTIIEMTTLDLGRDIKKLIEVNKRIPVNIVETTGFYGNTVDFPWIEEADVEELTEIIVRDIKEGIDGTEAKAGVIKFATSYNVIKPVERKIISAAANAHIETGTPIATHTEHGTMALEQIELLKELGVEPERVVIGHMDRNPDLWLHKEVAKTGAFLSYDKIAKTAYYPVSVQVKLIVKMFKSGFGDHILVSGDYANKKYQISYGGGPGFVYFLKKFIPRLKVELKEYRLDPEEVIRKIFIENPSRAFSVVR